MHKPNDTCSTVVCCRFQDSGLQTWHSESQFGCTCSVGVLGSRPHVSAMTTQLLPPSFSSTCRALNKINAHRATRACGWIAEMDLKYSAALVSLRQTPNTNTHTHTHTSCHTHTNFFTIVRACSHMSMEPIGWLDCSLSGPNMGGT